MLLLSQVLQMQAELRDGSVLVLDPPPSQHATVYRGDRQVSVQTKPNDVIHLCSMRLTKNKAERDLCLKTSGLMTVQTAGENVRISPVIRKVFANLTVSATTAGEVTASFVVVDSDVFGSISQTRSIVEDWFVSAACETGTNQSVYAMEEFAYDAGAVRTRLSCTAFKTKPEHFLKQEGLKDPKIQSMLGPVSTKMQDACLAVAKLGEFKTCRIAFSHKTSKAVISTPEEYVT